jgi:hypothetical protein
MSRIITDNHITEAALPSFVKVLKVNKALVKLQLEGNSFGVGAGEALNEIRKKLEQNNAHAAANDLSRKSFDSKLPQLKQASLSGSASDSDSPTSPRKRKHHSAYLCCLNMSLVWVSLFTKLSNQDRIPSSMLCLPPTSMLIAHVANYQM